MSNAIVPCLWFDDQAEQAAAFYIEAFGDGGMLSLSRYPQSFDNPAGKPRGGVMAVEFELAGCRFTAVNGGPEFEVNPSISFVAHVVGAAEAKRLFGALGVCAKETAESLGRVTDRFGVTWQVARVCEAPARVAPCLGFFGGQRGQADAALAFYASVFPGSAMTSGASRTASAAGEGAHRHGRLVFRGGEILALDSHLDYDGGFNEGVSLQVLCNAQKDVDHYWQALSQGGSAGMCGWLRDRFGVHWQIAPARSTDWLCSQDDAARDRVFATMMEMRKLDIQALQRAFDGE